MELAAFAKDSTFEVKWEPVGNDRCDFSIGGDVDHREAKLLWQAMDMALSRTGSGGNVVIRLEDNCYCSEECYSAILQLYHRNKQAGGHIFLMAKSPQMRQNIIRYGFDKVFTLVANEDELRQALK